MPIEASFLAEWIGIVCDWIRRHWGTIVGVAIILGVIVTVLQYLHSRNQAKADKRKGRPHLQPRRPATDLKIDWKRITGTPYTIKAGTRINSGEGAATLGETSDVFIFRDNNDVTDEVLLGKPERCFRVRKKGDRGGFENFDSVDEAVLVDIGDEVALEIKAEFKPSVQFDHIKVEISVDPPDDWGGTPLREWITVRED